MRLRKEEKKNRGRRRRVFLSLFPLLPCLDLVPEFLQLLDLLLQFCLVLVLDRGEVRVVDLSKGEEREK